MDSKTYVGLYTRPWKWQLIRTSILIPQRTICGHPLPAREQLDPRCITDIPRPISTTHAIYLKPTAFLPSA